MSIEYVVEFWVDEDHGNGWNTTTKEAEFAAEQDAINFLVSVLSGEKDGDYDVYHKYDRYSKIFKRTVEQIHLNQVEIDAMVNLKKSAIEQKIAEEKEKLIQYNAAKTLEKERAEFERLKAKFEK